MKNFISIIADYLIESPYLEIFKSMYTTPFLDTIIFLPALLLIFCFHIYVTSNLAIKNDNIDIYKFRFRFVNLIIIGGLYFLYENILSLSWTLPENFHNEIQCIVIYLIIYSILIVIIPIWYKTGSKIIMILYILSTIKLLINLDSFIYPYFYISFFFIKKIKKSLKESDDKGNIGFLLFIITIIAIVGISISVFREYFIAMLNLF